MRVPFPRQNLGSHSRSGGSTRLLPWLWIAAILALVPATWAHFQITMVKVDGIELSGTALGNFTRNMGDQLAAPYGGNTAPCGFVNSTAVPSGRYNISSESGISQPLAEKPNGATLEPGFVEILVFGNIIQKNGVGSVTASMQFGENPVFSETTSGGFLLDANSLYYTIDPNWDLAVDVWSVPPRDSVKPHYGMVIGSLARITRTTNLTIQMKYTQDSPLVNYYQCLDFRINRTPYASNGFKSSLEPPSWMLLVFTMLVTWILVASD